MRTMTFGFTFTPAWETCIPTSGTLTIFLAFDSSMRGTKTCVAGLDRMANPRSSMKGVQVPGQPYTRSGRRSRDPGRRYRP